MQSPGQVGVIATDNPLQVGVSGFYRRWRTAVDVHELERTVAALTATTQDQWIPAWKGLGDRHEAEGERSEAQGDHVGARREFLLAKTYFAIARFPGEITPEKAAVSADCARAYLRASEHLDPPLEVVEISHGDLTITAHLRIPASDHPVPAVLIMCGSDVFKEDRDWAQQQCIAEGMAALVMDAPGTGENQVPWAPESVSAWVSAVEYLRDRPEIEPYGVGAFGISRGGYSVMQLAGTRPDAVQAVVAVGGAPFGHLPTGDAMDKHLATINERAHWYFGAPGDGPFTQVMTAEDVRANFSRWALSELGVLDRITQPVLMINGDQDHLSPVGNIYSVLGFGPVAGKEARIFRGAGHCAPEHAQEWVPAAFAWLSRMLSTAAARSRSGSHLQQHTQKWEPLA